MGEEEVSEKKVWTVSERRKLKPTKGEIAKKKALGSRTKRTGMNPLKYTFLHTRGKLRHERCFKYEKSPGWHCLTYWDHADIRTLWLKDSDWAVKVKEEKLSPEYLRKQLALNPLPNVTPDGHVSEPVKAPEPVKAAPTECYPIEELRHNPQSLAGYDTITANAEANFARQEADRKIAFARHRSEVRTVSNQMSPMSPVAAEWE